MRRLTALTSACLFAIAIVSSARAQVLTAAPTTPSAATLVQGRLGASTIGGGWTLNGPARDDIQFNAHIDLQAGDAIDPSVSWPGFAPAEGQQTPWRKVGLEVDAAWMATPRAHLALDAGHSLEIQSVLPIGEGSTAQNDHNETFANLKAGLDVDHGLRVDLTGRVRQVDDAIDDASGPAEGPMQLRTDETTAGGALHWAASKRLSFDAGADLGYTDLTWRNQAQARQGYTSADPKIDATLTPWSGGKWVLSYGRAVTPVDLGAFVTVAQSLQRAGDSGMVTDLAPNREWRTQAQLIQALPGAGALNLSLTQARLESVTELTRNVAGVDLPGAVIGGERQQVDVSLAVPLSLVGLNGLSVETGGAVRRSDIVDPVTGTARRLSGEAPYDAHIAVKQDLTKSLRWGLQANAQAAQVSYTPEETSTAAQAQSLGMFVEYRPPAFALRLQVDGLAGADREYYDTYYDGTRASGRVVRTDQRTDGGPAFSLVLKKAL
ncbi:hypothetical protein [Caulobacter sp. S45]|uniref:hypothetical protein n=1 Tax=Caulobacter sp. S45 TaxID=1641861 RepID=UPI00131C9950|nr:hypothetical protein [Caulobacter sp. S45]